MHIGCYWLATTVDRVSLTSSIECYHIHHIIRFETRAEDTKEICKWMIFCLKDWHWAILIEKTMKQTRFFDWQIDCAYDWVFNYVTMWWFDRCKRLKWDVDEMMMMNRWSENQVWKFEKSDSYDLFYLVRDPRKSEV